MGGHHSFGLSSRLLLYAATLIVLIAGTAAAEQLNESFRARCQAHLVYTSAESKPAEEAIPLISDALALDPTLTWAYFNRGVHLLRLGNRSAAQADFEKSLALDPSLIYAHYNLACIHTIEGRLDPAFEELERALAKGYRKFTHILEDPDLRKLHGSKRLDDLLARYKTNAAERRLTRWQEYQTADSDRREAILVGEAERPGPDAVAIARQATYSNTAARVRATALWHAINSTDSNLYLARGLYDANGYVRKAAAEALAAQGKAAEPTALWALKDTEAGVNLYAIQILARVGSARAVDSLIAYLDDADWRIRSRAAIALAQMKAVKATPRIETALRNFPEDSSARAMYEVDLREALEQLKKVRQGRR